jgi:hypothetical protein
LLAESVGDSVISRLGGFGIRSNLFLLSDEQWRRIEPHLPTDVRGKERVNGRRVISAQRTLQRVGDQTEWF